MVGKTILELWLFGGNSNNGANCGLAYANSNNGWTNANSNISARLTTLSKKLSGCQYCVMGTHPDIPSLGSKRVSIACVGRNNIHLARKTGSALPPVVLVSRKVFEKDGKVLFEDNKEVVNF